MTKIVSYCFTFQQFALFHSFDIFRKVVKIVIRFQQKIGFAL